MAESWFFEVYPYRPAPYPGECLSGYLLRLAEVNGFSFWDLAADLFPVFDCTIRISRLRWEYPVSDWGRIPLRTQLPVAALRALTVLPWVEKFRSPPIVTPPSNLSPGHFLRGVVHSHLQVCPLCLQEQPYLRLMWRLAPVYACVTHGCLLQAQCHRCGMRLAVVGVRQRHLRCAACGVDLRTSPVVPASPALLATQRRRQAGFQFLLDPERRLVQEPVDDLPKATGLKFRYLRLQTGRSVTAMASLVGVRDGTITRLELGQQVPLRLYLTYLETLERSWPEFAAQDVPRSFVEYLGEPPHLHLRLCPTPGCPNHQPPPGMGVTMSGDLPDRRRARFRCSACGQNFTRTYEGELAVRPRGTTPRPRDLSRSRKSAEEVTQLVEMGLQGMSNRQIARRLGWTEQTVRCYWPSLGIEEEIHRAQTQRRAQELQERHATLRAQVEMALQSLLSQDDEITLERVAQAMGGAVRSVSNYPELVERVREAGQVHNAQVRKRRYEALVAQVQQIIEEARQGSGPLTVREIIQRTNLTYTGLHDAHPELHTMVRDAVNEHQTRMRIARAETRCALINAAAARLVAQGSRLTQVAILREAGLHKCGVRSDAAAEGLLRKWTSDFAPRD